MSVWQAWGIVPGVNAGIQWRNPFLRMLSLSRGFPRLFCRPNTLTTDWTSAQFCINDLGVSKASKAPDAGKTDNLAFEEALKRLEAIVEAMETEELPLETLLARYEEGVRMVRSCQSKLAEAEVKIQKLEKNSAGEPVLKPLPADLAEEP